MNYFISLLISPVCLSTLTLIATLMFNIILNVRNLKVFQNVVIFSTMSSSGLILAYSSIKIYLISCTWLSMSCKSHF